MTREEQIRQEIDLRLAGSSGDYAEGYEEGFIGGAKWADEHPNLYNDEKYHTVKVSCLDELNRKAVLYDEFLEKACDWIQMNSIKYVNSIGGCMYFDVINSTKDFKKAMES